MTHHLGLSNPFDLDFLSVDPGVEYFAWAKWKSGHLVDCGLDIDNRYVAHKFPGIRTCVVELTQTRGMRDAKKHKQVDGLIRAAGEIAGQFENRIYGYQHLPKKVFQQRTKDKLHPTELVVITAQKKTDQHHIWDAVGYGMKYLRRI